MGGTLKDLDVLLIDCQATGPNPTKGHLLEIAWARENPSSVKPGATESHLLSLPDGAEIPRRVSAITGIDEKSTVLSKEPSLVASRLKSTLDGFSPASPVPAVIHFARFERPFLEHLLADEQPTHTSLDIICTHQIARRVFPQLPSLGLRALAGNLGHRAPEHRRACDHVAATRAIWRGLLEALHGRGIDTLEELRNLLSQPAPPRKGGSHAFPMNTADLADLPDSPGVYRFLDRAGSVLYVGKATSLRSRVKSYFRPRGYRATTTLEMLSQAFGLRTTTTSTALEAALLEADEIGRLDPQYNTALRAGRSSPGPLQAFEGMRHLMETVHDQRRKVDWEVLDLAGLGHSGVPGWDTIAAGVEIFADSYPQSSRASTGRLAALGIVLATGQRLLVEEDDETPDEDEDIQVEPPRDEWEWTPARVARALERALSHHGLKLMRLYWNRILWRGEVHWAGRSRQGEPPEKHSITAAGETGEFSSVRMGVLTAELRRLLRSKRFSRIAGVGIELDPQALSNILEVI